MEEMHRVRCGERAPSSHALPRWATLPAPPRVHQSGSSLNNFLLNFHGNFVYRHNWLNHWALAIDLPPAPLPSPEIRGWEWKFQPSNQVNGSPGHQPPYLGFFQKSLHSNNKRYLFHSQHLKFQWFGELWFRNCVQRPNIYEKCILVIWMTKYIFLTNHSIIYLNHKKKLIFRVNILIFKLNICD